MKLLFVSIAFPPKADPECIQTGRYYKALKNKDEFDIQVLTSKSPTLFMDIDNSLTKYLSGHDDIIEIPIYETKRINFLIRKLLPGGTDWPDSKFTFHLQWKKAIRKIRKPDIIYSRSFPLSSAIMALKLTKYYNVPWVMHLSDPWVESPLHGESITGSGYHHNLERECFSVARLVSFTTEEALQLYAKKYSNWKSKFFVSSNVFDLACTSLESESNYSDKIRIVYTGGLANTRTAEIFLESLVQSMTKYPQLFRNLDVVFAGGLDSRNREIFKKYRSLKCVRHLGVINQEEADRIQNSANILLVIDSQIRDTSKNVFLPSKILDYAIKHRLILAITERNSPTDLFLKKYGGVSFSFDEGDKISDWLIKLIKGEINLNREFYIPKENSVEYQVDLFTEKVVDLLNK